MLIIAAIFCWIQGLTFPCLLFFTYGTSSCFAATYRNDIGLLILTSYNHLHRWSCTGGFSGLLWYLYNPLNEIYTTVGGLLSNGSAEGIAALGIATTAVPFVRAVSILLIVSSYSGTYHL